MDTAVSGRRWTEGPKQDVEGCRSLSLRPSRYAPWLLRTPPIPCATHTYPKPAPVRVKVRPPLPQKTIFRLNYSTNLTRVCTNLTWVCTILTWNCVKMTQNQVVLRHSVVILCEYYIKR
jgi:hypothetical protein